MTFIPFIAASDVEPHLTWPMALDALEAGCRGAPPQISDLMLDLPHGELLNRAAAIEGIGLALKTVSIYPDNPKARPPRPTVQGVTVLFDDATGAVKAIIDGALITKWKTAADSALGAKFLARSASQRLLIIGAGAVAQSLIGAYSTIFPDLEGIDIWSRDPARAKALIDRAMDNSVPVTVASDRATAADRADIIATATGARDPVLLGEWVSPGTHIDLVGGHIAAAREADNTLMQKARIFVDSRETTLEQTGDIKLPLTEGAISRDQILGDLYDLAGGFKGRVSTSDITVFKNGGGAHFDLMIADFIFRIWSDVNR